MGYKSGGLSYFEDGRSTTDVEEDSTPSTFQVKPSAGKGKFALPTAAGNLRMSESVLNQMEQLYIDRQIQRGGFMEAMKDAAAWASGGVEGPTAALAKRDEIKRQQDEDIFQMQSQMAQYKAAQRQAQAQQDLMFGKPSDATQNKANDQQVQQGIQAVNQYSGGLLDLVRDEGLKRQIGAQFWSDPAKAMTQLNVYLAKQAEETPLQKNLRFAGAPPEKGGLGVPADQLPAIAAANIAGSGAFVPHDVRTSKGTTQTTPLQAARDITKPPGAGGPADPRLAAPKPLPQAQAQGQPQPGAAQAQGQPQPVAAQAQGQPQPVAAQAQGQPQPGAAPAQSAPVARQPQTQAGMFGFAPGSKEDLALRSRLGEEVLSGRGAEAKKIGEDLALQRAAVEEAGSSSGEQIARIEYLNKMLNDPKLRDAFGVLQKPGVAAAFAGLMQEGLSLANMGQIGFKGLDDAVAKLGGTQAQIDARQKAAREFALMQLQNAKTLLKGQGAVSDAERKLIADMSGNIGKTPAALRDLLAWSKMRSEYDKQVGGAFRQFIKRNPMASFQEFKLSDQYEAMKENYDAKIKSFASAGGAASSGAPHPAASLVDKYAPRKK